MDAKLRRNGDEYNGMSDTAKEREGGMTPSDMDVELNRRIGALHVEIAALDKTLAVTREHAEGINAELGRVATKMNGAIFQYVTKDFCQQRHSATDHRLEALEATVIRTFKLYWVMLGIIATVAFANLGLTILAFKT